MSYKILLADDSVTVQKIITLTFSDEGVDVLTVNNGNDAINRLHYMRPALVMADVSIPGRNGYEICEFVKNHPELRQTPVILLVPAFETFDEERAQRIGADYHLTKPFQSIRTLIATVKNLIERKEVPANAVTPARAAAPETEGDLLNGKSAKIEELLKKSTAPLPPIALADDAPLELLEDDAIDPLDLELAPVAALEITELEDEFLLGEDEPVVTTFVPDAVDTASAPTPTGDDVLELDDVLPELHPVIELAPTTNEPVVAAEVEPTPVAATAATGDESLQLSPSVIDEIVARIVAQLSTQLADDLAERLNERLTERLIEANGDLARQLAPQVAEILQAPAVSSYRITENLLEID